VIIFVATLAESVEFVYRLRIKTDRLATLATMTNRFGSLHPPDATHLQIVMIFGTISG